MSLKSYWEPWKPRPVPLELEQQTDSDFIEALVKAFGRGHDFIYSDRDLPILQAMAAVNSEFQQLVDAVQAHGTIRVWGET